MKVTLVVLSFACFLGALHALPLEEEEFDNSELRPQVLPNFEETPENEAFPSVVRSTRPPQIHHNAVKSQGPFSGRLINVVANKQGAQKTVQRNTIEFNFEAMQKAVEELLEHADNE